MVYSYIVFCWFLVVYFALNKLEKAHKADTDRRKQIMIKQTLFCVAFLCAMLTTSFSVAEAMATQPEPPPASAKQTADGRIVISLMSGVGYFDSFARCPGLPANVARRPVDYFYALEDGNGRLIPVEDYPYMHQLYGYVYLRVDTPANSRASRALLREAGKRSPRATGDVLASLGVQIKHDDVVATAPSMPKSAEPAVTPTLTNDNLSAVLAPTTPVPGTITNADVEKVVPQTMEPVLPSDGIPTHFVDVGGSLSIEMFERERCRVILRGATEEFSAQYWPRDGRYIEYNNDSNVIGGLLLNAVTDNSSTEVAQTLRLYPSNTVGDSPHAEVTVTVKVSVPAVSEDLSRTLKVEPTPYGTIQLQWGKTVSVVFEPGRRYLVLAPKDAVEGISAVPYSGAISYEYGLDYRSMRVSVQRSAGTQTLRVYNYSNPSQAAGLEVTTAASIARRR